MKISKVVLASLVLSCNAVAQETEPCGPFLNAMETVRIPDFDDEGNPTGNILTVSTGIHNTYELSAIYTAPELSDSAIEFTMNGELTYLNKRSNSNKIRFRQSIYVPEGLVPFIPNDSPVCWDPNTRRLVRLFESIIEQGDAEVVEPIQYTVTIRKENQVADINADGVVDATDQGILISDWNSDNYRSDLNFDGLVNSSDLGILLTQWSESSNSEEQ